jgi:hypothetical protein
MEPIEFIAYRGDSAPNTPVGDVAEAMYKDISVICDGVEVDVLSYYYDSVKKRMVLELST